MDLQACFHPNSDPPRITLAFLEKAGSVWGEQQKNQSEGKPNLEMMRSCSCHEPFSCQV
jgi:hypothetical protein